MLYGVITRYDLANTGSCPNNFEQGTVKISSIFESDPRQASVTLLPLQIRNAYFVKLWSTSYVVLYYIVYKDGALLAVECLRLIFLQKLLVTSRVALVGSCLRLHYFDCLVLLYGSCLHPINAITKIDSIPFPIKA
jgi:hypothetical protein